MAIMVPQMPPIERGATKSENAFWRALRDELPDEFYVLHSLPFLTEDAVQGEADFLVMHPEMGVLNIEVKGKGVHRGSDGQWYRTGPSGRLEPMNKAPSDQAQSQIEGVVDRLAPKAREVIGPFSGKFPLVFGWAIAFPFTRRGEANLPPSLRPEVVMHSSDLGRLEERVRDAFAFYGDRHGARSKRLRQEDFENFIWEGILEPYNGEPTFAGQLDYERQRFIELSSEQQEVMRSLLGNHRLAVSGGAGTGKTVLAMHAARLLAERGDNVLVTCFNSGLATQLRKVRERWGELDGDIFIDNFHAICVDAADGDLDFPARDASREEQRTFWAEKAPFSLLTALEKNAYEHGPWDAIIVDEGQDFYHEWWPILETGLCDDGRLVVFFDERQSIFEHGSPVPTEGMTNFKLRVNFRNTKAICRVVSELGAVDLLPHERCPAGETPSIYQQEGPAKTQRKIGQLLDRLVEREGFRHEEIAILSPHRPKNSVLEAAERLGAQPVVHDADAWMDGEGVLHCTISAFKGMEADTVILVDVDPEDERCTTDHRYVAASRAKLRLHVFEKENWMEGGCHS